MQRLPTLTDGQSLFQLPLSDTSAARLSEALLLEEPTARIESLVELLSHDPALTLWSVCRAASPALQSTLELSSWLAASALDVLDWSDIAEVKISVSAEQAKQWRSRMVKSISTARKSANDLEYLAGLLCEADQWLADAKVGDAPNKAANKESLLPLWLVKTEISGAESDESSQSPEQVADQWLTMIPGAEKLLIPLIHKLLRLRALEDNYEATLQKEKIDALKELAYGASHEINNPLANISTRAQTLLRDETDPERRQKLETINRQAFRAHEMITHMMQFARPPRLDVSNTNLNHLINEAIARALPDAQQQETDLINKTSSDEVIAHVDVDQLGSALHAMIVNSLQALRKGGRIELAAQGKETATITIRDTGPGIPEEVRPHVFDPFYSGREAGRGLGFGLCKCWGVVQLHGGTIEVDSSPGNGTVFTIRLPKEPPGDQAAAS